MEVLRGWYDEFARMHKEEPNPAGADKVLLRYTIHVPEDRPPERVEEALKAIINANNQESVMTIAEMWLQQGCEEVQQHDRRQFLKLLDHRFGEVPEAPATRVLSASQEDDLDAWMLRLLSAETIEAVFQPG